MQGMAAERFDADFSRVTPSDCGRAIIGFQHVAPIHVFNHEYPGFRGAPALVPIECIRRIAKADTVPAPTVSLKDTPVGNSSDHCDTCRLPVQRVLESVETSANVRKAEWTDQALVHMLPLHSCQDHVCRRPFHAIAEFESA